MLRFLLTALVALAAVGNGASEAEACGVSGCLELLNTATLQTRADHAPRVQATVAPAADEEEIRARERRKRRPATPAFWRQFRSYAYKQLPKHTEQNFRAVWIAMPVRTADGTVATVGIKGFWW